MSIVELEGTVGDIESAPFVEAMRQFQFRVGYANFALIHVSLVPDMASKRPSRRRRRCIRCVGLRLAPRLSIYLLTH